MVIIIENLVNKIKSKPPTEWSLGELEDFAYTIQNIYVYSHKDNSKEDNQILHKLYDKIVDIINKARKGTMINPGFLMSIDNKDK